MWVWRPSRRVSLPPSPGRPGAVAEAAQDAVEADVERLLAAYRQARDRALTTPWRDEIASDIVRSAVRARDALKVAGSPHVAKLETFIEGMSREDFYARAKRVIDKGLAAANLVGAATGNTAMKDLRWGALALFAALGAIGGFFVIVNVAAAVAAAVPIGWLLARGPTIASQATSSLAQFLRRPNPARQVIDEIIAPAEAQFFLVVTGRPPMWRTATVAAAVDSTIATALYVAIGAGAALGLLIGLSTRMGAG